MKQKGIEVICGSVFVIGFVIGMLLVSIGPVSANGTNLVTNGDFSDKLEGWNFTDTSMYGGWAKAQVVAHRARIMAHGTDGSGLLTQDFTEKVIPKYYSTDFELKGQRGEWLNIRLNPGISYYVERKNGDVTRAYSRFHGKFYEYNLNDGTCYDKGTLSMSFDYETSELKIYISGEHKNTFTLPIETEMPKIGQVGLVGANRYDGKPQDDKCTNVRAFFDNIILERIEPNQEIPEFTSVAIPIILILATFIVFSRKKKRE